MRLIHMLHSSGYNQSAIANALNRWGIPTRLGGRLGWRQGQVRRLLVNEAADRAKGLFSKTIVSSKVAHAPILPKRDDPADSPKSTPGAGPPSHRPPGWRSAGRFASSRSSPRRRRDEAAVRLPRRGGDWDPAEPATDGFRKRMVALAVRDLGADDLALAMHSLAAMPSEPGGEDMDPPRWGWSAERTQADAMMMATARSGDARRWEACMDDLIPLATPYSPRGWRPLALGLGAYAM